MTSGEPDEPHFGKLSVTNSEKLSVTHFGKLSVTNVMVSLTNGEPDEP